MARATGDAPNMTFGPLQTGGFRLPGLIAAIERGLEAERAQLPLWLPVMIGLGIAAWFAVSDVVGWFSVLIAAGAMALAGIAIGVEKRAGLALLGAGIAIAAGLSLIWSRAERLAQPVLDRPVITHFVAHVANVERLPARGTIRLILIPEAAPDLPPQVRVNVDSVNAPATLVEGARIRLRARLLAPAPPALPGGYDFARAAWFMGIGATGRALGEVELLSPGRPRLLDDLRRQLSDHIVRQLPGGAGAIAATLATGDEGAISEADADAMRRSGLAHLLSISGLHVTALVGGVMLLTLRLLALSRRLALNWPLVPIAAGAGALAGIGYTLLTGAEVPTVRSCIAALLVLAGIAAGREAITLRLVATGAVVVLLIWPESLIGPSFQLSFAAVTAIVVVHETPVIRRLLQRRDEGIARRLGRTALSLLITGIAVELALLPIALAHFHRAGLYGALANMIAIPLTTFVIMPVEAVALLFDMVGWGAMFWWIAGQALGLLLWVAHSAASAPGSLVTTPVGTDRTLTVFVIGMLWFALWQGRVRWLGVVPVMIAIAGLVLVRPADILITGDGRHTAIRIDDDHYALLRPRAGDYVRDMLAEHAGIDGDLGALDAAPGARCGRDTCVAELHRGGRSWRLLATRSGQAIEQRTLAPACAASDIVISDRSLPGWCRPRWLKADRELFARSGGLAIDLAAGTIDSVTAQRGRHPWVQPPAP